MFFFWYLSPLLDLDLLELRWPSKCYFQLYVLSSPNIGVWPTTPLLSSYGILTWPTCPDTPVPCPFLCARFTLDHIQIIWRNIEINFELIPPATGIIYNALMISLCVTLGWLLRPTVGRFLLTTVSQDLSSQPVKLQTDGNLELTACPESVTSYCWLVNISTSDHTLHNISQHNTREII